MTSYILSPVWGAGVQLFDNNGDVLTGGKIYTYVAGTTTPVTTYTTSSGSVANTNPIIADAAGRLNNEIWLLIGNAYKFVLKDANDVLIATYDDIPSVSQTMSSSIKDFGAVGDGITDNTAAIQAALNTKKSVFIPDGEFFFAGTLFYTADNQCIFGNGNTSILKHRGVGSSGPSWISSAGFNNLTFQSLQLDGGLDAATQANPGVWIVDGSVNFTANNCLFTGGNQVVYLGTCSNVKVVNNTFDGCGFGVIQRFGFASSNVLVDGNTCRNARLDFVEANCGGSAPSENWIISNNTYDTNQSYPVAIREGRFVGITSVRGVTITGNTVSKSTGDSAVHLEDTRGEVIVANNVFDNCLTFGGNVGYIWPGNNQDNTIISDNIFLRTDTTLPAACAVNVGDNPYSNSLIISDNFVRGESSIGNLSGLNINFRAVGGATSVVGNVFQDVNTAIECNNARNTNISSNSFVRCSTGIASNTGTLLDTIINANNFVSTFGANDIVCAASTRLDVQNNRFSKNVSFGTSTDVFVNNNTFNATASLNPPIGTRAYAPSNIFEALSVSQSKYDNIGSTYQLSASKRAVAGGGSAAVTFRLTCTAIASDWAPGTFTIRASACDSNGSTFTAAWWTYRFQVLGGNTSTNAAVSDSGGTVGSYVIAVTGVSASAAEVVFDVSVTATNADWLVADLSGTYYYGIKTIT